MSQSRYGQPGEYTADEHSAAISGTSVSQVRSNSPLRSNSLLGSSSAAHGQPGSYTTDEHSAAISGTSISQVRK
jgi:hypothetical protein